MHDDQNLSASGSGLAPPTSNPVTVRARLERGQGTIHYKDKHISGLLVKLQRVQRKGTRCRSNSCPVSKDRCQQAHKDVLATDTCSAFQGQRSLCRSSKHSLERPQLARFGCGLSPSPSSERRCHSKALCGGAVQPWS